MAVQPQVLEWARRTAGLSVEQAAKRIGVRADRIVEWEHGEVEPTIIQLRRAADAYDRPFAALFVEAPPRNEEIFDLPDFRRPSTAASGESTSLRRAILRARRQQDAIQEVIEEGTETPFVSPDVVLFDDGASPADAGHVLREALGLNDVPSRVLLRPEDLLRHLVRVVERRGYLVIQVQNVSMDEMRGFSLGDGPAPVIALNGADWPRGKIYTLLHELVHVGRRHSGLCDLSRDAASPEERYCDEAAAAALMPAKAFARAAQGVDRTRYADLAGLAHGFGASAESGLLRLVDLKLATWDEYQEMKPVFREAYQKYKRDEKDANADKDVPIYYQLKARDLGRPFIRTILRAHDDGAISARDVAQLLEVSYDKLGKLAEVAGAA
ncbi:helix-turn-helix domain-containing protein [Microbacterium sp. NPDC057407]|uniref:helix-turn-helix domain-containing protein n=1 Tax=Microbacterium sp. NPDC057407 TaxID=3346120 RepID=UPI00366BF851